ncbi:hypothetical protein SOVF_162470 [Spinacia oleracea]|uniref:BAG family molecular chaperone regulator 6 n=1 Tax=Spinacia oleracea TaxID=3562 RepID=A0A9R0ILF2_SPIOL|nr:BAG family molecular chaperone regulator 6 [Spinacia oleracea]KNA08441.1 hypothetical protein SOVF_162470 [Spinacia oleracea]
MFPAYTGMNSYPYQRSQMPSTQYYYPSWEAVPPQMKEDPPKESLPHNYGYLAPMQCHSCCTHGQYPAYYNFRPPCSHFPPPPTPTPTPTYNHFCGGYPPYPPQSHPMYYAPPPHYSMELPRYEFDKSAPRDQFHCCGCSNHPCHVKGRNNVTIEEQEPDVETKKSESLFPAGANNFQHPVMRIPSEYTMNKEQPRKLVDNEASGQQILPYLKKPQVQVQQRPVETEAQNTEGSLPHQGVRSVEKDPNLRNGWFPLDINRIKQLMDGGEAVLSRDQENKSRGEKKGCGTENKDQNMQSSSALKVVPRKLEHNETEAKKGKTAAGDDDSKVGTLGVDKKSNVRIIPVKQLEEHVHKLSKNEEVHKVDLAALSKASQDAAKNCTGRQSLSHTKKSKLPPICLRVDPPKKKNGNRISRSPSPPGVKEGPSKGIKVKDVEKIPSQNKIQGAGSAQEGSEILKDKVAGAEKMVMQQGDSDNKPEDAKVGGVWVQAQELQAGKEDECEQESKGKEERRCMTDMEAAVVIQSAYRGYSVRRRELVKKLKQIARICEEAILVKKHIEDIESCSAIEDKEKAAVGETIMNLLLKLDAIQGLHEIVRDVRKSVAKDLINLQEKLDSIRSQKCIQLAQDTPCAEASEGYSVYRENSAKAFEGEGISSNDLSSTQTRLPQDVEGGSQNESSSEEIVLNLDSQKGPQDKTVNPSGRTDGNVVTTGLDSEVLEKEPGASETVQGQLSMELKEPLVNANHIVMDDDMVSENKDEDANFLSELPLEVVEEESLATSGHVDAAVQNDLVSGVQNKEEHHLEQAQELEEKSLANMKIVKETAGQNEDQEAYILRELPVEVVEEDDKEIPVMEGDLCASKFASQSDDGKELTKSETSGRMNNDLEVDQPSDWVEEENEDLLVKEKENSEALEICNKKIATGEEVGYIISAEDIEMPLMEEVDGKPRETTGKREISAVESGVQVEKGAEVPDLKENQDQVKVESSILLMDPFYNNEDESEIFAGDQGNGSEILKPELRESDTRQSEEKCRMMVEQWDDQSSVVGGKKDEQIDKTIIQENEKLREMLEKLVAAGKEQQEVIFNLEGKLKDLEKKLTKKKNKRSAKHPRVSLSRRPCGKPTNGS